MSTRADARDNVLLVAMIRRPGSTNFPVRVRNLSAGGMMVMCPILVSRDEAVEIELPGVGCIDGKIAWTFGSRIGIQFDRPIDPLLAGPSGKAG